MSVFVIVLFAVGLLLIIFGGDRFVDASVIIARSIGLPEIVIGATIVSLGTTMPEILVSTIAGFSGNGDISVGNALGSVICNTSLIGGIVLLFLPPAIEKKTFNWRIGYFYLLVFVFVFFGINTLKIGRLAGFIYFALFGLYAFFTIKQTKGKGGTVAISDAEKSKLPIAKSVITLVITALMMFVGAKLLVDNGILIALALGVPERIVAVTFIALGTSLPELVTAITAIRKKFTAISIGNIVGANLINFMGVIAIPAVISTISVSAAVFKVDIPLAMFVMGVMAIPPMITGKTYRLQGVVLIATYAIYNFTLF